MINTQGFPVENPALYIYRVHSGEPLDVTGRIIKYGDVPWIRRRSDFLGWWHFAADPEPADVPVKAVAGILGACGSNVGSVDDLVRAHAVAEGQRCPACQGIVVRRVTVGRE